MLSNPTIINFPKTDNKIVLDRDYLDDLVVAKLLKRSDKIYVYFALSLDYPEGAEGLHKPSFCDRWGFTEPELDIAIAALEKKLVLKKKQEQLAFYFVYPESI